MLERKGSARPKFLRDLEVNGERLNGAELRSKALELRREREAAEQVVDFDQRLALLEEAQELLIDRLLLVQEARRLGLMPGEEEIGRKLQEVAGPNDGV